jgi:hypothetical protein
VFKAILLSLLFSISLLCTCGRAQKVEQVFGPDFYEDFNDVNLSPGGCRLILKCGTVNEIQHRPGATELFALAAAGIIRIEPGQSQLSILSAVANVRPLRLLPNPTNRLLRLD